MIKSGALLPGTALICFSTLLSAVTSAAAEDPWIRFENPHFIAYSNASGKKALGLLEDLETFRAAFLQVGNIRLPADAPKTQVFIPATRKEFLSLSGNKLQAGFATFDGTGTLIVMPAQGEKGWTRTVMRHEYGHALLRFKKFNYPAWYEEGFAELVSSTELVNQGRSFTIGKPPDRAMHNGPPLYDWDELVSDEFRPHALANRELGSSAYAQAWLLAHYATLGDDLKNATLLQKYFDKLKDGESSGSAFKEAFGASASQLWSTQLKAYAKRVPVYTFSFKSGAVNLAFAPSPATRGELDGILGYLRVRAATVGEPQPPKDVLASLPGRWAAIHIGMPCEEYSDFAVNPATETVTITRPDGVQSRSPEVATYRYELSGDGTVRLEPVYPDGVDGDGEGSRSLKHRTTDLLCVGPNAVAAAECVGILHRCGA